MVLQESGEMYLETILILTKERENVRAIDVGQRMGFSKPSVSRALGLLRNEAYITTDLNGHIKLTESGKEIAEKIYERHMTISEMLETLGISHEIAQEDACRIEHVISDTSFEAIKRHLEKNDKK